VELQPLRPILKGAVLTKFAFFLMFGLLSFDALAASRSRCEALFDATKTRPKASTQISRDASSLKGFDFNSWMRTDDRDLTLIRGDVAESMRAAAAFQIHGTKSDVIESFFFGASPSLRSKIHKATLAIDHVGYILPAQVTSEVLNAAASQTGLFTPDRQFASTIVAKELGARLGVESVPTQIFTFNARTDSDQRLGIEIFVPQVAGWVAKKWIQDGVGSHVALKMRSREDVASLSAELLRAGFEMPAFMNRTPMDNPHQGSLTSYFDVQMGPRKLRVELVAISDPKAAVHKGNVVEQGLAESLNSWVKLNRRIPNPNSADPKERTEASIWAVSLATPALYAELDHGTLQAFQSATPFTSYETGALVDRFVGEDKGLTLWSARLQTDIRFNTVYLGTKARKKYSASLRNGLICGADGQLFDSSAGDLRGLSNSTGRAMIAMDEYGNLYLANEQEVGRFHHSSFTAGGPLAFAGEAMIKNGVILSIKNLSGHYLPRLELFAPLLERLHRGGVDISKISLEAAE
jgi:hypothetical protein